MSSGDDCIRFEQFVELLHAISQVKPRRNGAPRDIVKQSRSLALVNQWFAEIRRTNGVPPDTWKIVFRLFFPEEDVRRVYNIKENVLSKTLAREVFGLSIDAQGAGRVLMEWCEYSDAAEAAKLGCLGTEVERVLKARYSARQGESPSIRRVDTLLDDLASLSGYSNLGPRSRPQRTRAAILKDLYFNLDPLEAKFMTQIILKDLRPVLYPLTETHTTRALLHYKSNALHMLTKWEVMNACHPSMPEIYRARATLDEAARAVEELPTTQQLSPDNDVCSPLLGIPIEIPKSRKGVKLSHALGFFRGQEEVWAETKYDGERMQIHVDLARPFSEQIRIFSKSKRNSTQDRMGTHPIIRASLGLPPGAEDCLQYPSLRERMGYPSHTIKSSVILDAEMVAYSEWKADIDEFWRIRSLVESTAHGVRHNRYCRDRQVPADEMESGSSGRIDYQRSPGLVNHSLQSNASDNGDRHLMIVFFDIMYLDGVSLLHRSYRERRAQLEHTINIIPGYVSLSRREVIQLSHGASAAVGELSRIFAQHIANHREGLVLKGSASFYNGPSCPWVKVKRDYIPGYGDTVDLVILGAGWNKERARELRVGPETFTTFFVAALDAPHGGWKCISPQFQILFTVEYGMERDQLETLNFYIKSSEPQLFSDEMPHLGYKFQLPRGLAKPTVMFSRPLLGELFGAGFSKDPGSMYYSLRFPRLTKVWRSEERDWTAGSCLEDFQKISRSSIGRESGDDWARRNVDEMWGLDVSPGPKDAQKIAETMRIWHEKLLGCEGISSRNMERTSPSGIDRRLNVSLKREHKAILKDITEPAPKRQKVNASQTRANDVRGLRALASMTNLSAKYTAAQEQREADVVVLPSLSARTNPSRERNAWKSGRVGQCQNTHHPMRVAGQMSNPSTSHDREDLPLVTNSTSILEAVTGRLNMSSSRTITNFHSGQPSPSVSSFHAVNVTTSDYLPGMNMNDMPARLSTSYWPQQHADAPIVRFIQDAYVWIHRNEDNKRPQNRPPASHLVPSNRRIGVIYFLLIICGCRVDIGGKSYLRRPDQFAHVNKCVIFVKRGGQSQTKEGLTWLLRALESWRTELNKSGNKELFVFDSEMITYTSLSTFCGDVASQAVWRSSRENSKDD